MLITIFAILTTICLAVFGWILWQVRCSLQNILKSQDIGMRQPALYRDLTRQVDEIHQTMGGVVNSLRAMGHQVHTLNMLAGNAMHESQMQLGGSPQAPQIMIEIRPTEDGNYESHAIMPEDMSPEVAEKFKTFQNLFQFMMTNNFPLPSQHRPDLN